MGSIIVFKEITSNNLYEYDLSLEEINEEQKHLVKEYSKRIVNEEMKLETLLGCTKDIKNVLYVDIIQDMNSKNKKILKLLENFEDELKYVL